MVEYFKILKAKKVLCKSVNTADIVNIIKINTLYLACFLSDGKYKEIITQINVY